MWLVEFSLAHRIPVACFSCHKINKISISCLNYSIKQEILLKNLLQNQQNLKARGIYSCTGIYFFKSAMSIFCESFTALSSFWESPDKTPPDPHYSLNPPISLHLSIESTGYNSLPSADHVWPWWLSFLYHSFVFQDIFLCFHNLIAENILFFFFP